MNVAVRTGGAGPTGWFLYRMVVCTGFGMGIRDNIDAFPMRVGGANVTLFFTGALLCGFATMLATAAGTRVTTFAVDMRDVDAMGFDAYTFGVSTVITSQSGVLSPAVGRLTSQC